MDEQSSKDIAYIECNNLILKAVWMMTSKNLTYQLTKVFTQNLNHCTKWTQKICPLLVWCWTISLSNNFIYVENCL